MFLSRSSAFWLALVSLVSGAQIVVQAEQLCETYSIGVDRCWEEVGDPSICPDPFPTFPTCNETETTCSVVVVGAAIGGLYTAVR